jgi:hypothetical protein
LNRLITTFDEVPPTNPHASQRRNHGVTFKTSTVEVFRPTPNIKPKLNTRDPQGLRRPRFSFFIFTCQTAWNRSSAPIEWEACLTSSDDYEQPGPTDCAPLNEVRSNIGANACPGQFRSSAALSDRVIGSANRCCQRPMSTNRRIESFFFGDEERRR